jgi:hypothetical protein
MPGLFHEIGQAELSLSAGQGVQEFLDDEPASGLVRGGLHAGGAAFPGSAVLLLAPLLPNFPPGQAREVGEQPTGVRIIPPEARVRLAAKGASDRGRNLLGLLCAALAVHLDFDDGH